MCRLGKDRAQGVHERRVAVREDHLRRAAPQLGLENPKGPLVVALAFGGHEHHGCREGRTCGGNAHDLQHRHVVHIGLVCTIHEQDLVEPGQQITRRTRRRADVEVREGAVGVDLLLHGDVGRAQPLQ